jgi:hypothetical protein
VSDEQPSILRELTRRLTEWRSLQLKYYLNPERMSKEYPPVILEAHQ